MNVSINILADVTLPHIHQLFTPPFQVTSFANEAELLALLPGQEILLCRSTLKLKAPMLDHCTLKYVATASSGSDHIDTVYLKKLGITLLDARGANATAVADYVVATIAWLSKKKLGRAKTAGIIGFGEIGKRVFARIRHLGFATIYYDPWITPQNSPYQTKVLQDIAQCDLISLHPNWHHNQPFASHHLIDSAFLQQIPPETILINSARGEIIDQQALLAKRESLIYCTDVYLNEPHIERRVVEMATIATPHIAGHTVEGKQNCLTYLRRKIYQAYAMDCIEFQPKQTLQCSLRTNTWQNVILGLYDPSRESAQLKAADHLTATFKKLRQAHQFRHDFARYDIHLLAEDVQKLIKL